MRSESQQMKYSLMCAMFTNIYSRFEGQIYLFIFVHAFIFYSIGSLITYVIKLFIYLRDQFQIRVFTTKPIKQLFILNEININ